MCQNKFYTLYFYKFPWLLAAGCWLLHGLLAVSDLLTTERDCLSVCRVALALDSHDGGTDAA